MSADNEAHKRRSSACLLQELELTSLQHICENLNIFEWNDISALSDKQLQYFYCESHRIAANESTPADEKLSIYRALLPFISVRLGAELTCSLDKQHNLQWPTAASYTFKRATSTANVSELARASDDISPINPLKLFLPPPIIQSPSLPSTSRGNVKPLPKEHTTKSPPSTKMASAIDQQLEEMRAVMERLARTLDTQQDQLARLDRVSTSAQQQIAHNQQPINQPKPSSSNVDMGDVGQATVPAQLNMDVLLADLQQSMATSTNLTARDRHEITFLLSQRSAYPNMPADAAEAYRSRCKLLHMVMLVGWSRALHVQPSDRALAAGYVLPPEPVQQQHQQQPHVIVINQQGRGYARGRQNSQYQQRGRPATRGRGRARGYRTTTNGSNYYYY